MAFPETSVLDSFTRADEDPVNTNWSMPTQSGDANCRVSSGVLMNSSGGGGGYGSCYWSTNGASSTVTRFGPVSEVYATVNVWCDGDGENLNLYAALSSGVGTTGIDGYELKTRFKSTGDQYEVSRLDDGAATKLGNTEVKDQTVGAKIGLDVTARSGTEIGVYWATGSTWAQLVTRSDTTYDTGFIGIRGETEIWELDDFGGGTVSAASTKSDTDTATLADASVLSATGAAADTFALTDSGAKTELINQTIVEITHTFA